MISTTKHLLLNYYCFLIYLLFVIIAMKLLLLNYLLKIIDNMFVLFTTPAVTDTVNAKCNG